MDGLTGYRRTAQDLRETAKLARSVTGGGAFVAELCALKMEEAAEAMSRLIRLMERMEDDGR